MWGSTGWGGAGGGAGAGRDRSCWVLLQGDVGRWGRRRGGGRRGGGEAGRRRGGGERGGEAGGGWAVVKARATPGNPASISLKRIVCLSLSVCLCLSVSVCLNAFAQFSRYRAETLQVGQGGPGTGRGGVKNFGGAPGGGGVGVEGAYTQRCKVLTL